MIDNNNYRVQKRTEIDLDESKLIDMLASNQIAIYIIVMLAVYFNLYYLSFSLLFLSLTFNAQKQISKNNFQEKIVKNLDLVSNNNFKNKYSIHLGSIVKEHGKDYEVVNTFNWIKKLFGLMYDSKTIPSQILTSLKQNSITPVLLTDEQIRTHTCLMATTGGGKTELLINGYIESTVARGGGVFAVFGKSDNVVLQKVQSVAAKYNRLSDLLIYDFAEDKRGKTNSNTINIFELGNKRSIITSLVSIADFDTDTWGKDAKTYLSSFLDFVLSLKATNFFIDITKIDDIYDSKNKFEEYQKHIKTLDYFSFSKLISDNELLIKLLLIFDDIYKNNKSEINQILYKNFEEIITSEADINLSSSYLANEEKNQFHQELKQIIINQSAIENWEKLVTFFVDGVKNEDEVYFGMEALSMAYPNKNGVFYNLQVSISNLKNLFEFFNSFPSILKNQSSDISILDSIDSNKIVIFNIPGQNKVYAPILSELVVSILNSLLERRGKDYKPDVSSLVCLDEVNSWLKIKKDKSYNLGDIMSVIRGLFMGAVVSFQSSLKETLGSVDASQVMANANTTITLRLKDPDLLESLNKELSKVKKLDLEENISIYGKNSNQHNQDTRYNKTEEDYFKPEMLANIKNGEGFIIRNGSVAKFMAKYTKQKELYKSEKDDLFLNRYITLENLKKEIKC